MNIQCLSQVKVAKRFALEASCDWTQLAENSL